MFGCLLGFDFGFVGLIACCLLGFPGGLFAGLLWLFFVVGILFCGGLMVVIFVHCGLDALLWCDL